MKRDVIPVCSVHGRFQTINGRWLNINEDLKPHIEFTNSSGASTFESVCDLCDDPNQSNMFKPIHVNFREQND